MNKSGPIREKGHFEQGAQHEQRKTNYTALGKGTGLFYAHTLPHFQPRSKYPAVSSERERSRYAAVFQDQYAEFLELQQEVGSAQAKLQQLEALLTSLPPPRSQVSNQVETPTPESFQVARLWPLAHLLGPDLRPLLPPGWAGTTAHGQTSTLKVLPRLATLFL